MTRYLLFDAGCNVCLKLARNIERIAEGWLIARSLGDRSMQALLKESKPGWRWEPTLLEIANEDVRVFTGPALAAKIIMGLGLRRASRIARLMHQAQASPQDKIDAGRRRFLRQGGALLVAAPLVGLPFLSKDRSSPSRINITGWARYRDPDFGFSLEYPAGWQVEIHEQQPTPLIDDEAILKRVAFSSAPALVYLDVWLAKGKSFADWLAWYKETRLVEQMAKKANAAVAGKPAATFLQNHRRDLMLTYFSDGEYVYRLLNWMTGEPTHLNTYWHMLDTFSLPGVSALAAADIPLSTKHEGKWSSQRLSGRMVTNCCYTDSGNPFPCCNNGNCTWWCYYKYNSVPFSGNAGTWWNQAKDHYLWVQSSLPVVGGMSIACWAGGTGHVAHAANWSGSGDVSITEMTWCESCDNSRNIAASNPSQGWIYAIYV